MKGATVTALETLTLGRIARATHGHVRGAPATAVRGVSIDSRTIEGKFANKLELQHEVGLPVKRDIPLFANITRLADQKGVDIQLGALEEMLAADMQFVLLGSIRRQSSGRDGQGRSHWRCRSEGQFMGVDPEKCRTVRPSFVHSTTVPESYFGGRLCVCYRMASAPGVTPRSSAGFRSRGGCR